MFSLAHGEPSTAPGNAPAAANRNRTGVRGCRNNYRDCRGRDELDITGNTAEQHLARAPEISAADTDRDPRHTLSRLKGQNVRSLAMTSLATGSLDLGSLITRSRYTGSSICQRRLRYEEKSQKNRVRKFHGSNFADHISLGRAGLAASYVAEHLTRSGTAHLIGPSDGCEK